MSEARTLSELGKAAIVTQSLLQDLGLFKQCHVTLGLAAPGVPDAGGRFPVQAELRVQERGALMYGVRTEVNSSTREMSLKGHLGVFNALGRAEAFRVSYEHGNRMSHELLAQYRDPRFLGGYQALTLSGFRARTDHGATSSFVEKRLGASAEVDLGAAGRLGAEAVLTELSDPTMKASRAVVAQLGDRVKLALSYARQGAAAGALGAATWRSVTEVAGPYGSGVMQFARQTAEGAVEVPLGGGVALALGAKAGLLLPFGESAARPTPITERLFLGGTSTLRGFHTRGAGPSDARRVPPADDGPEGVLGWGGGGNRKEDALGADLAYCARAAVRAPLPATVEGQRVPVFLHAFADVGAGALWRTRVAAAEGAPPRSVLDAEATVQDLAQGWRASAGVGVLAQTPVGQVEFNVTKVLRSRPGDAFKGLGFQFGVSSHGFE